MLCQCSGQAAQQGQGVPLVGIAGAIPLLRQRAREIGMDDHAAGLVEHRLIRWHGPDGRIVAQFLVCQQAVWPCEAYSAWKYASGCTPSRCILSITPLRKKSCSTTMPGYCSSREHILVRVGVAEVVEPARKMPGLRRKLRGR
jgi:hypothetical protein